MKTIDKNGLMQGVAFLLLILTLSSCGGQNGSDQQASREVAHDIEIKANQAVMIFDTLVHDFGTIIEGEQVVCYFEYMNGGEQELLITSVEATCGCTTTGWSREPLRPGEKNDLRIIFDSSGRSGVQRKLVTVYSNASNAMVQLTIRANVNNSVSLI